MAILHSERANYMAESIRFLGQSLATKEMGGKSPPVVSVAKQEE